MSFAPNPALFFAVIQGVGPEPDARDVPRRPFALPGTSDGWSISQPFLSYGDRAIGPTTDYLGVDDATEIWWDPTAPGPDEIRKDGVGMYQFVDGGKRYLPGQWPTVDKVFDPTGAVSIYTSPHPAKPPATTQAPPASGRR